MAPRAEHKGPSVLVLLSAGAVAVSAVGLVRERLRNMDLKDVLEATEYEVRFLRERTQELARENEQLRRRVEELEGNAPPPTGRSSGSDASGAA